MAWVAVAVGGAAVVGAVVANNAANSASSAQRDASRDANSTQLAMYHQTRADQEPWRQAGQGALNQLSNDFVFGEGGYQSDPGYKFRLAEGTKAINASAAARGGANSGANMKALARYGQDYASNEYNNAYNRNYSRLSALAGFGNTAANQNSAAGQNYANQMGSIYSSQGNANAANSIAQGNAINGGLQGVGNAFTQYQTMNSFRAPQASTVSSGYSGYQPGSFGSGGI